MDQKEFASKMAEIIDVNDFSYDEIQLGRKAYDNHFQGRYSKDVSLKYMPWETLTDDQRAIWCYVAMGVIETAGDLGMVDILR